MRSSASLLSGLRRRPCCRVVSYSIPDDVMRITGSCGIRLACPSCLLGAVVSMLRAMRVAMSSRSSCRRAVRSSPSACLMFPPYASTLRPSSHRSRAWLRAVSLCVPQLVPLLRFAASSSRHSCRPMVSRFPPRLIDTLGGAIRRGCCGSLCFACLLPSVRHLIRAVWHWMATGLGDCLIKLTPCLFLPPWPSSVPPATRSLAQSDFLAALPPYRLPPRLLDTGDGAEVS